MKKKTLILNLIISIISINSFGQLTNGLKAYYTFGGNVDDISGQNNNGNFIGSPTLIADRFGNSNCAYEFPGNSTNYINVNYSSDFNIPTTGSFTISLWFQGGTPDIGDFEILFEKENPLVNPYPSDYHIGLYDGNNPSFGSLYSPIVMSFTNHPNPDPNWHHVVSVYDNKKWYIYEDNILTASNITQTYGIFQSTNNITIGKYFMGKLDDIRFYNRILTVSEINELYNLPSSCQSLSTYQASVLDNFSIYPNPAKNLITITSTKNDGNHMIYIYDMTGREVMKFETSLEQTIVDIATLKEGIYLVKNKIGQRNQTKIFIKK